jgi:hypothetical protein
MHDNLLPKKKGPQLWEDVALPGLEEPAKPAPPPLTAWEKKKLKEKEAQIVYRRHNSTRKTTCHDCAELFAAGKARGVFNATYVRIQGSRKRYLCFQHHNEWRNNELLGKPGGPQ